MAKPKRSMPEELKRELQTRRKPKDGGRAGNEQRPVKARNLTSSPSRAYSRRKPTAPVAKETPGFQGRCILNPQGRALESKTQDAIRDALTGVSRRAH